MKTPLAWLNLLHDKTRTSVAVAGVAFAVVLVLMQLGFLNSVEQTATQIYSQLDFDVLIVSQQYLHISKSSVFPRTRLDGAQSAPGVEDAKPLYLGFNLWLNNEKRTQDDGNSAQNDEQTEPDRPRRRGIFVMAYELGDDVFKMPELATAPSLLSVPGNVLMDTHSRKEFGEWDVGSRREVGGRQITIAGKFSMGTGFGADGAIITSDQTFVELFPGRSLDQVSLGLVKLKPGENPDVAKQAISDILPKDVKVLTRDEIYLQERNHWVKTTSVGVIFKLGVVVGFIVGTAIVYQVLSSDIANHMSEYATLKAMGYDRGYLTSVVIQQALILSVVGYVPGLALSYTLYWFTSRSAHIPMTLTPMLAVGILGMSIAMCSLSGVASLRKVTAADPADLF